MDFQTLANIAVGAVLGAIGWFGRQLYEDMRGLGDALAAHKLEVAKFYATNEDVAKIDYKLDKILDRLERKVDR